MEGGSTSSFDDAVRRGPAADVDGVLARSAKVRGVAMTLCYLARGTCEHAQVLRKDRYRGPMAPHAADEPRGD